MKSQICRFALQPARTTIALFALGFSLSAAAIPLPPIAPATSTGTYSVTLQGCSGSGGSQDCASQWIEERTARDSGWRLVDGLFVNKPPGAYEYRAAEVICDPVYFQCQFGYSSAVTVIVGDGAPPVAEPLDVQLGYQYSVRYGNVTGDAGTDLLIERVSGPADGNGVIDAVILQQGRSGSFHAVVPTAAQRSSSIWLPSALPVSVEDMNADGFVDVAIRDIGDVVPGAEDQIVFASGSAFDAMPKSVRAFDESLAQFTANLIDYIGNEQYFADNASQTIYTWHYRFSYCPGTNPLDSGRMESMLACASVLIPNFSIVPDYSAFDSDAVNIWQDEIAVARGDLTSDQAAERIAGRIEDVFDVDIGGWDMREIFGDGSGIDDPAERRGLEAFLAILGIGNARADEVDPDEAPAQGSRANDVIHIVSRYVFGSSVNKMHTAALYKMPGTGLPTWFSAFDSDDRSLFDGTLVGRTSDPADSPLLMRMTLGEVLPPTPQSRFVYFFTNMQSAHEHYKGLPDAQLARYDAVPEFPCGGCNGRNSNGYVNGLILASRGTPRGRAGFSFDALTGWEYPVEAHYFGR
jgi:hypothetical protein